MKQELSDTCRCGKKFGHHFDDYLFEVTMKPKCVACGITIKGQCEELYYERGNYCPRCSGKSDFHNSNSKFYYSKNKIENSPEMDFVDEIKNK